MRTPLNALLRYPATGKTLLIQGQGSEAGKHLGGLGELAEGDDLAGGEVAVPQGFDLRVVVSLLDAALLPLEDFDEGAIGGAAGSELGAGGQALCTQQGQVLAGIGTAPI